MIEFLDQRVEYPLSDSRWASSVHYVPNKENVGVVKIMKESSWSQDQSWGGGAYRL